MYSVCAAVNDVEVIKCNLNLELGKDQFQPRLDAIFDILSGPDANRIKLLFLTSPGNPTGTSIPNETIRKVLEHPTWRGLVVVDEAYIDFSDVPSAVELYVHLLQSDFVHTDTSDQLQRRLAESGGYANTQQRLWPSRYPTRHLVPSA
jgi:histidinol-phosphate aminotransferase